MKKSQSFRRRILTGNLLLRWITVLTAALAFHPQPTSAAVTEAWVRRYSNLGDATDEAFHVVRDPAGDFLVAGVTADGFGPQDLLLIKYSGTTGAVVWQKRYHGPADILISLDLTRPLPISAAAVDNRGNLVLTAKADNPWRDGARDLDFYTAKYSGTNGALLWERRYDGPAQGDDVPIAMAVDASDNVIVTGYSQIGRYDIFHGGYYYPTDIYTAKYAGTNGAVLWETRYDSPAHSSDAGVAIAIDANTNVIITGVSYNSIDDFGSFWDGDIYTAKYAGTDGALIWETRYNAFPGSEEAGGAVAVDASGNVLVAGYSSPNATNLFKYDFYTAKYAAANGALLWEKRYNGPANQTDLASSVAVDASGNVIVTGVSYNTYDYSSGDFYTAKYAATNGALVWERRYNGPANTNDVPEALAVDSSGNVVVTGYSLGTTNYDFYTVKYASANGALLWERRYNGPGNRSDFALSEALDASGNIVVSGVSGFDFYTAKYAAANGAVLWESHYSGPSNLDDKGYDVAVDSAGNVIVTGISLGSNGSYDLYTAKYAYADGALLWEKRDPGPSSGDDYPEALALDTNGNVLISAHSSDSNGSYVVKYAAANGAQMWRTFFNSRINALAVDSSGNVVASGDTFTARFAGTNGTLLWQNASDPVIAVAVDTVGNAIVTGGTYTGNDPYGTPLYDLYTAKFAAANGALLWDKHYNGPANSTDFGRAVAVDVSGNVVVTGDSVGTNFYDHPFAGPIFFSDCYTAKYAAADGALLWDRRYSGPGESRGAAIAVDAAGNVAVTGRSYSNPYVTGTYVADFYTAKYAAANGALLWETRYNDSANADDLAYGVVFDQAGNVIVAGSSGGTNIDYYTAAYAATDGTLLWEKRYDGPLHGTDEPGGTGRSSRPHCLALGPNGMIAVTGGSNGDYATVVYRDAPVLRITVSNSFAVLSWPAAFGNYQLQENTNVALSNGWSAVVASRSTNNGFISVTSPATNSHKFFRLSSP
jgi:outer membrane protein assembly factor BamB